MRIFPPAKMYPGVAVPLAQLPFPSGLSNTGGGRISAWFSPNPGLMSHTCSGAEGSHPPRSRALFSSGGHPPRWPSDRWAAVGRFHQLSSHRGVDDHLPPSYRQPYLFVQFSPVPRNGPCPSVAGLPFLMWSWHLSAGGCVALLGTLFSSCPVPGVSNAMWLLLFPSTDVRVPCISRRCDCLYGPKSPGGGSSNGIPSQ